MQPVKKVIIETENHTITLTEEPIRVHPNVENIKNIGITADLLIYKIRIGNELGRTP